MGAEAAPVESIARVHLDGGIVCAIPSVLWSSEGGSTAREARYTFGLPGPAPSRRWLEERGVPICRTAWETNGIRYTQSVLVTGSDRAEASLLGLSPGSVLLVCVAGENTASQYTEASAAFTVEVEGRALSLAMRDGVIYAAGTNGAMLLAVVDVAGEGIAETAGPRLRFRGNMPPGTSGSMTIKIPAGRLEGEDAVNRVRDLEFDDELRRVTRFWRARREAGLPEVFPVAFAEAERGLREPGPRP